MDDQIVMDEFVPLESLQQEVSDIFLGILSEFEDAKDKCVFRSLGNGESLSIAFFDKNYISFWIYKMAKSYRLTPKRTPSYFIDSLEALYNHGEIEKHLNKSKSFAIRFSRIDDLHEYAQVIRDVYFFRSMEARGRLYDCCHRYEECSDARDCTHPDKDFSMCCSYRRNLKRGTIFFGKNRNIE